MKKHSGFTLTELILVLAMASIIVAMGMPQLSGMVKDNRRAAEVNRFVTSLNLARTEAIKRRTTISACASTDGATCNAGADWEAGWIVFANLDGDDPPVVDAGETLIRVSPATGNDITIRGFGDFTNAISYGFDGYPRLAATSAGGRINFCDDRGVSFARAVLVSNTGRARLSTDTDADGIHEDEGNNDLTC
ncbi:MAG: GspH/FimT family pseudopilin [Gammaproteobacteria bacterium]|nr:GspH/FimT family pseudopilin [Gammaproteobacteria bacterium]MDH3411992.1 GspH/FimT family pseudopilin [Gammaproteobacteria bacterium]